MSEQFQQLLAQLEGLHSEQTTLAKALPAEGGEDDDKAIQAASDEGDKGEGNDEEIDEDEDEEGGDEKPMTKSIKLGDEEVEIVDAEELVKSVESLTKRMTTGEEALAKGLGSIVTLVKGQNALIKSLQDQVSKLAAKPAGRKSVLSVQDKPSEETLTKSQDDGMTVQQFLAKSHAAFDAKKITGKELTMLDVAARNGKLAEMDHSLIAKVVSQ